MGTPDIAALLLLCVGGEQNKRTELLSVAMFEDGISRHDTAEFDAPCCNFFNVCVYVCVCVSVCPVPRRFELNPLSPPKAAPTQSSRDAVEPIVLHKVFVMPAVRPPSPDPAF